MNKKIGIQLSLIILLVLSSLFFYREFFKTDSNLVKTDINENKTENDPITKEKKKSSNVIESLRYVSQDLIGNTYIINAESAKFEKDKLDKITLFEVNAEIIREDSETIKIYSNIANYNKINNDTVFRDQVSIKYQDQLINSEIVKLNFSENLIEIIENVYYMNGNTKIIADKVELDLLRKKMKISMINQNDEIQITGKY